jgi:hypothetical protein
MSFELLMRPESEVEPVLAGPRDGDDTETSEKGGGGGETKRAHATQFARGPREGEETEKVQEDPSSAIRSDVTALDPRDGDETETSQRDGGSQRQTAVSAEDPRDGDDTVPIRESPLSPPVRV